METKTMKERLKEIPSELWDILIRYRHTHPKSDGSFELELWQWISELIEKERGEAFKDGYKSKEDEIRDSEISDEQQNKIIDKVLETKNTLVGVARNRSDLCPVCKGVGIIPNSDMVSTGTGYLNKVCHGCGGRGWVIV